MFHRAAALLPIARNCTRVVRQHPDHVRHLWSLNYNPFYLANKMFRDFERLERSFFGPELRMSLPFHEHDSDAKKYRIRVNIDDHSPEDVKVSMKGNVIKIETSYDRTSESDSSRTRKTSVYEFTVPSNVDLSTLKSFLRPDGVLCIEGNVTAEQIEPKEIPIQIEGDAPKSKL